MTACLVYITAADKAEAVSIGRALVAEHLAACANVHGPIVSIFSWEGEVQEAEEVVLIAKTGMDLVKALTYRVVELHSYECPCVVAIPIAGGHEPFLNWIEEETRAARPGDAPRE